MITFLTTRLGRWLSALGAALAILAGVFAYGRSTEKQKAKVRDLEAYKKTMERVDEVGPSPDRIVATERLRHNGWVR